MSFIYTQFFEKEFMQRFNLNRGLVESSVMQPRQKEFFNHHGYCCTFFLGQYDEGSDRIPLVVAKETGSTHEPIAMYFIPSDIATRPQAEELVFVLGAFAARFGLPITIAGVTRTFFYRLDLPIAKTGDMRNLVHVNNPHNKPFTASVFVNVAPKNDEFNEVRCGLALAIDINAYELWLRGDASAAQTQRTQEDRGSLPPAESVASKYYPIGLTALDFLRSLVTKRQFDQLKRTQPNHPLIKQCDAIEQILHNERDDIESTEDLIGQAAQVTMDAHSWGKTADVANAWNFIPEEPAKSRVTQTILNPESYQDMLAQLYVWGALRERGISSRLREQHGMPDLAIYLPDGSAIGGEVKCLRITSKAKNLTNLVGKANSQLKNFDSQRSGILFIRMLCPAFRVFDDSVPADLHPFFDVLQKALASDHYKSVGQLIVSWDDYMLHESKKGRFYAFRRRSVPLQHRKPRSGPRISTDRLLLGSTFTVVVRNKTEGQDHT